MVQAIINLGNAMGMTVTAEGVETAEQLALLSDDQCHEVQGFLLSKPLENEALIGMLSITLRERCTEISIDVPSFKASRP